MEIEKIIQKSPSIRRFLNGILQLAPERALTPFTACDAYRNFAGRALWMTSQK